MKSLVASFLVACVASLGMVLLLLPAPRSSPVMVPVAADLELAVLRDRVADLETRLASRMQGIAGGLPVLRAPVDTGEDAEEHGEEEWCDAHCASMRAEIAELRERLDGFEAYLRYDKPLVDADKKLERGERKRSYGPEQVIGLPDTPNHGDKVTAWASATPDNQDEWLILEFSRAIRARELLVYETYNPGAVYEVTAFDRSGDEVVVWSGDDPTPESKSGGVSRFPLDAAFPISRVRLRLASRRVKGWNEVDAVALVDGRGRKTWANGASASSTYADLHSSRVAELVPFLFGSFSKDAER